MATHSSILDWRIPHGQRSLVGYSLWGCKELHTTEVTWHTHTCTHINVYIHTYICVHTHTHTYIYIYTHTYIEKGFPGSSVGKESACSVGDLGSIPGSLTLTLTLAGGRHGNPLQYSCLENSRDRGTW